MEEIISDFRIGTAKLVEIKMKWIKNAQNSFRKNKIELQHYLSILLFGCVIYLNSLNADFTYDDNRAILNNDDVTSNSSWYQLLINDFWGTPIRSSNSHGSYRPITVASFRINHAIHGAHPFGYHLTNLILHLIVTIIYTIVIDKILQNRKRQTLIASFLFASHPIHVESVTSIVGRADIGAAFFYLLSLFHYLKFINDSKSSKSKKKHLFATLIYATLSMLTKEHGITCLLVCVLYHFIIVDRFVPFPCSNWIKLINDPKYENLRLGMKVLISALFILISARMMLFKFKPSFSSADNPASSNPSLKIRSLTFYYLPVFNFWLLIYPKWLSFDWSMESIPLIVSWFDYRNIFILLFYGAILLLISKIFHQNSTSSIRTKNPKNFGSIRNETCRRCDSKYILDQRSTLNYENLFDVNNNDHSRINFNQSSNFDLNNNSKECVDRNQIDLNNNNNSNHCNFKDDFFSIRKKFSDTISVKPIRNKPSRIYCGKSRNDLIENETRLTEIDCLIISMILMIVPFLPATNLFFYVGFVVAERIIYIPSFGFCLLIAICIDKILEFYQKNIFIKNFVYISYSTLIIVFAIRTVLRNIDWLTEENLYRAGAIINPPKAYGNLGNILSSQGKKEEAEEFYRKALSFRFNMADVHYNLGLLLQSQHRYKEAIESYENAIKFRPRLAMAYLNLGSIFAKQGLKNLAKKFYEKCSLLDSHGLKDVKSHEQTRIFALHNLGQLLVEEEDYGSALNTFKKALFEHQPYHQSHSLLNMIGEVYLKINQTNDAEIWLKKSMQTKIDYIPAYLNYAKLLIQTNQNDKAEKVYKKAIDIAPNDIIIYHHLARLHINNGQPQKALKIYQKAYQLFPNDCDVVINIANLLRELKKNKEAETFYKIAVKLRPNDVLTYSNLGAIYHLNGKLELARINYLKALELKPNDNITKINMARLKKVSARKYF
ncbi:Protein O-mannosyl-transferase TMTC2 [Sarcoptes scabiei]|uniref:dolichyl-phosphate-mannose--protein mannosyltransferase n=1 Tax=Sarcoptes scabiei TaxID=52283 RepID=A0A834VET0_SARSC|nr:Protein O-mannosyl-transferase TMTC2 [Sarcoptes scabiei]